MKWLIFLLFTSPVFAFYPYELKESNQSVVCDNSFVELKNTPPIRDQGSIGLCYAFASLLLLEHHKCAGEPDPQACYSANRASAVDMSKHYKTKGENEISIGGVPSIVLTRFQNDRKLVNESCTHLDGWKQLGYEPPFDDYFHKIHSSITQGANQEEILCFAQDLNKKNFGEINELYTALLNANELTSGQLRSELLYKKNCTASRVDFPAYRIHTYPSGRESKSAQGILNFVKSNLDKSSPVEVSFCSDKDSEGKCSYHSAVITGVRNVCSMSNCSVQYKIQNSYGRAWQDNHDQGWVNAKTINESILSTSGLSLTSISKPEVQLAQSHYTVHSSRPNTRGFCGDDGRGANISTPSGPSSEIIYQYRPEQENEPKYKFYECKDANGRKHFSDKPLNGMFCKGK